VLLALAVVLLLGCTKAPEEQLAEIRLQQEIGSWEQSIAGLREFLEENPGHPEANLLLGTAQIRLGQPALAIWPLEIAARSPDWANEANIVLGIAYLQVEQYDPALAAADSVLAAQPEDIEQRLQALRLRAAVHLNTKEWEAALENTEQLLSERPDDAEVLLLRANALVLAERAISSSRSAPRRSSRTCSSASRRSAPCSASPRATSSNRSARSVPPS
jgi:tetratricopeptide (TPR) repeat protein